MKTVVFDLDGTLLDSAPDIIDSLEYALAKAGIILNRPIPVAVVGPPVREMIDRLGIVITKDQELQVIDAFRKHYDPSPMLLTRPYWGAQTLLAELQKRGWSIFFATNKPCFPTARLIERFFSGFVDDFCCVDTIPDKKLSKREMLEILTYKHSLKSQNSIMIGDRSADIRAGREIGWRTIAVGWGYGAESKLRLEEPTWWARSMENILECLERYNNHG
ncbi:MAG: HAD family hydrolase [Nitrospirae bacterium]|nr:HAD family hydrolase [Candidatus Troglogloeales bacterium]